MDDLFSTAEAGTRPRGRATVLVAGDACDGRFAIVETQERHGSVAPCHIHSREDEFVYVLAGRVLVQIGEAVSSLDAGECLLLPRGHEHAIVAESQEARLLLITTPAGIEGYYRELELAPDDDPEGIERLIAIAARYGLTIIGPALNAPR